MTIKTKAVSAVPVSGSTTAVGSPATSGAVGSGALVGSATTPTGLRLQVLQMLQGWQTAIPAGGTLGTSSGPLAQATIVEELQSALQQYAAVDAQVTVLKQVRAQLKAGLPQLRSLLETLKAALTGFYGVRNPALAQFGLKPRGTPAKLKSEALVVRTVKANATRKQRGTLGSRQKKAVVFSGQVQLSTQVTEPAVANDTATPAPEAPSVTPGTPTTSK